MTGDKLVIHLFICDADQQMSKIAQEVLRSEKPTILELRTRIKETESAVWYNRKEYGKVAARKESTMSCKPCQSSSNEEANCWGPCTHCGKRNHKASYCKFKDNNQSNTQTERADKSTTKNKKKKKNKTGKKVTVNNAEPQKEDDGESEEEVLRMTLQESITLKK